MSDGPRALRDWDERARRVRAIDSRHVAPLNQLVRGLRARGRPAPWVDPVSGGVESRILLLLESPGPKAPTRQGSGFVSPDNDDRGAERLWRSARTAGLRRGDYLLWNVVPWYTGEAGVAGRNAEADDARDWLHRFVTALPRLEVVVVMGAFTRDCWLRYQRRDDAPVLRLVLAPHPAARTRDADVVRELAAALRKARDAVRSQARRAS